MLYFNSDEMKRLLEAVGYKVEEVQTWDYAYDTYYQDDEDSNGKYSTKVVIATKDDYKPTKELLEGQKTYLERAFGLKEVFEKELKERVGRLFK